jgi:hypothetical protein
MIAARATIGTLPDRRESLGHVPGGVGAPEVTEGRAEHCGEILVDDKLDADVGSVVGSWKRATSRGKVGDLRYNFGVHTIFMTLQDAQNLRSRENPRQRGDHARRTASTLPGLTLLTSAEVKADLQRPRRAASSRSISSRHCSGSLPPESSP